MRIFLVSTILSFVFSSLSFAAENSHHGHGANSKATETKSSKKFIADDALKERMNAILGTMEKLSKNGSVTEKKKLVVATGSSVESVVHDIFKSCKLAPDADAAIHPILAQILDGAAMLKKGDEKNGHEKIHNALLKYEENFEHVGWKHSRSE